MLNADFISSTAITLRDDMHLPATQAKCIAHNFVDFVNKVEGSKLERFLDYEDFVSHALCNMILDVK